jgi:hypothetical protein
VPVPSWLISDVGQKKTAMADMPEKDWRYLRSIQDDLIERVSEKMNAEVAVILAQDDMTARAKRVKVYEIAQQTHYLIMDCFDHWKRSNIWLKCRAMMKHGVLEEKDLEHLTPETADHIRSM